MYELKLPKTLNWSPSSQRLAFFTVSAFLFFISITQTLSQSISGQVLNERNEPIPFANIYVQELESGTATDLQGKYFLTIEPGHYHLVISSVGFISQKLELTITDEDIKKIFWLKQSNVELDEVVVKAKRKDPAYEIIQNVIANKRKFLSQVKSSRTKVYLKATEVLDVEKSKRQLRKEAEAKKKEEEKESRGLGLEETPLDEPKKKMEPDPRSRRHMVEMEVTLNYQYPNLYKEERTAFEAYGSKEGLYVPNFGEVDFNFYRNLVTLTNIADVPVISPFSRTAVLTYKFKLEDVVQEDTRLVYKIKVSPRKAGYSSLSGYVFINDGIWNINRLELSVNKGALKLTDAFTIKQEYKQVEDSLWLPMRQEFNYITKQGRLKTFEGNTVLHFSEFENNYQFPPKFFGNEIAVTTQEALERDSAYWEALRPEPLTEEQLETISYRDSIEAVLNSKEYKDSMQAKFNKVTLGEAAFHGFGFRNWEKKRSISFASVASLINFEIIGGWRIGPYIWYSKRWENEKVLWLNGYTSYGLKNQDFQGTYLAYFRYDPRRLGDTYLRFGRNFEPVNSFDAYLNQLKISNYILVDRIGITHRRELFNGFYVLTGFDYFDRRSLEGFDNTSILNKVIDETEPLAFDDYQALITEARLIYRPKQRYITEPKRKVVLGSKYPTFSLTHRKGWNGPFGSDINFDYLEFAVDQDITFGTLGNSKYRVQLGKFVNSKDLRFVDLKRFRESDPYLYSDPLNSFQLLDTSLVATDWHIEAHHIHHFNGALVNNIPFVKKLKIRVVAGGGALWIKESDYRHAEIFGGIERIFKIGVRRRLRLGVYGVLAESNRAPTTADFKISFDVIDTWKKNWSY